MTLYDKYEYQIEKLTMHALSLMPNNKKNILSVDNLSDHSGMVQYYVLKKMISKQDEKYIFIDEFKATDTKDEVIDNKKNTRRTNIMITEPEYISDCYNKLDNTEKILHKKKIHNNMQQINRELIYDLYDLVYENRNLYQAKICELTGFSKDVMNDNNWIIYTYLNMMVEQGILSTYEEDRHRYYDCIENKLYKSFPFIENSHKSASKLEAKFANFLIESGYEFEQQCIIPGCKYKRNLPFDFKIKTTNGDDVYVEINGRQHYEFIPFMHDIPDNFILQLKRDNIKHNFCKENDIPLIEIPYNVDMEKVFKKELSEIEQ
jgi:hypothetical protein